MAHVVCISVGRNLHPRLELGRRLTEAGHRVTFVSHRDMADEIAPYAMAFFHLSGDHELRKMRDADPMPRLSLLHFLSLFKWIVRRRRLRKTSIERDDLEALIKRLAPDILLIDVELHYAVTATARLGIPTGLALFMFSLFRRPGLPPLHSNWMPARTFPQKVRIQASWAWSYLESIAIEWRRRWSLAGLKASLEPVYMDAKRLQDLGALARSRGYALRRETDRSQWLRPYMYRRLPVLCFNALEMEFPHERPPNMRYVGPVLPQERYEPNLDAESRARWEEFLRKHRERKTQDRPMIYCALGSFLPTDRDFLFRVIDVFRRRQDWDLVLGLGGKLPASALAPVSPNVILLKWAPQLEILQHADCAITHAGISTMNECIWCKVPMVLYSTRHIDQNGNAARISFHGLGTMGDKDKDSPRHIERNIERCLGDEQIRRNLEEMKERFLAYGRDKTAIRVIEELAG